MSSSHLFFGLPIALLVKNLELRSRHHSAAFFSHLSLGEVAILSANFHFIFCGSCSRPKDDNAILEPSALCVRSALVNRLYCTDVCCEWVSCLLNRNHHHSSDDVGCHELQLICHCEVCHCGLKMKTLPGFDVALCSTAIQFSDRHSNRSCLLLRIVDVVVDVVDVLDVSVSEIVAFPPSERLAFQGIVSMQCLILVAVEEAFGAHEPVDLLLLTHVFEELFLVLMFLEHLDQLRDSFTVEIEKPGIR